MDIVDPHTLVVIDRTTGEHIITETRHSFNEIMILRSTLRTRFGKTDYNIQIFAPVRILAIDEIHAMPVWEGPYYSSEYKEIRFK